MGHARRSLAIDQATLGLQSILSRLSMSIWREGLSKCLLAGFNDGANTAWMLAFCMIVQLSFGGSFGKPLDLLEGAHP